MEKLFPKVKNKKGRLAYELGGDELRILIDDLTNKKI
jgi:hypothetical protein